MTLPIHIDHHGQERKLALLPPTPRCAAVRAAADRLPKVYPQSQWVECDYWAQIPDDVKRRIVQDQGQYGSCTAFSCVTANVLQRYFRTGKVEIPSGAYLYDCINGGADNGSVITDAKEQMVIGVPDVTAYAATPQFRKPLTPSGKVYREGASRLADSPEEYSTALFAYGAFPQLGICVTPDFENFTKDGIAWGGRVPRGQANHSIATAGAKRVGGIWCYRKVGTWGSKWGPFGDGTCWIPVAAAQPGGWVHISTEESDDKP